MLYIMAWKLLDVRCKLDVIVRCNNKRSNSDADVHAMN